MGKLGKILIFSQLFREHLKNLFFWISRIRRHKDNLLILSAEVLGSGCTNEKGVYHAALFYQKRSLPENVLKRRLSLGPEHVEGAENG